MAVFQPALPQYRVPVFRELARRPGINLTLHYADTPGLPNAQPDGFEARPLPVARLLGRGPFVTRELTKRSRQSDVAVFSWNANDLALPLALRSARRRGVGSVLWGHGFGQPERPLRRRLRDALGRRADAILLYDKQTAAALKGRGFEARRLFVAQNALDEQALLASAEPWRESPNRLKTFREEHRLQGRKVLLFVGRLSGKLPVELLLDAVAAVRSRSPEALFVMIGGPAEEADRLRDLAAGAGVAEAMRFVGPVYDHEQLAAYFLTARGFAFPRTIGLSLMHAFAYGLPVVTDDAFGTHGPEIRALRDGENGLLYRAGDAASFAEKLLVLLKDDVLHAKLSAGAAATVRDDYNLKTMVDGFEAAVRFAAAQHG